MKILIASDGLHAHYFQRQSWLRAFNECGLEASFWHCKEVSAFDAFDTFEPDIFLGQSYNLDSPLIKCIYERPHLKVGLRAGDWGDFEADPKFNVLYCSEKEKDTLKKLKDETGKPDFVHIHYSQYAVDQTHSKFKSIGIDAKSLIMCANVHEYVTPVFDEGLSCDIGFLGGYWPYKGIIIDKYLAPLLHPVGRYNVKIFGNQPWPNANQYCGYLADEKVKDLFISAKICPNLSEPHAHEFGFDINERCFKILCAGGFCISDNIEGINKIFNGNGVVFADSPDDFKEKIDYYLSHEDERKEIATTGRQFILDNHTNFHRIAQILSYFGCEQEAQDIIKGWNQAKEHIDV